MKRTIALQITLEEHGEDTDGAVTVWFHDLGGAFLAARRKASMWDAAIEIGAYVAENATDGEWGQLLDCDCDERSWYGPEHDTACACSGPRVHAG